MIPCSGNGLGMEADRGFRDRSRGWLDRSLICPVAIPTLNTKTEGTNFTYNYQEKNKKIANTISRQ